jgi:hypothetical protein
MNDERREVYQRLSMAILRLPGVRMPQGSMVTKQDVIALLADEFLTERRGSPIENHEVSRTEGTP